VKIYDTLILGGFGTELDLQPIGVASKELVSEEGIAAMNQLAVTRIFVDPIYQPAQVYRQRALSRRKTPVRNF